MQVNSQFLDFPSNVKKKSERVGQKNYEKYEKCPKKTEILSEIQSILHNHYDKSLKYFEIFIDQIRIKQKLVM